VNSFHCWDYPEANKKGTVISNVPFLTPLCKFKNLFCLVDVL